MAEKSVKMDLSRTYLHRGAYYGPGKGVEVPASLRDALRRSGASPEARMVPVNRTRAMQEAAREPYDGDLPSGFPHLSRLQEAGIVTMTDLRDRQGTLQEVNGIGPVSETEVREAFGMLDRGEGYREDESAPGAFVWTGNRVS